MFAKVVKAYTGSDGIDGVFGEALH